MTANANGFQVFFFIVILQPVDVMRVQVVSIGIF
jgi:hypothetical protein